MTVKQIWGRSPAKLVKNIVSKLSPRVYVQDLTLIYSLLTLYYFILYIEHLNVDFSIFLLVFTHFSVLCGVRRMCSDEGAFTRDFFHNIQSDWILLQWCEGVTAEGKTTAALLSWLHLVVFWVPGGPEQVSRKSRVGSGLLLPAHLLLVCIHQSWPLKDLQAIQTFSLCQWSGSPVSSQGF